MSLLQLLCGVAGIASCIAVIAYQRVAVRETIPTVARSMIAAFSFLMGWSVLALPPETLESHTMGLFLLAGMHCSTIFLKTYLFVTTLKHRRIVRLPEGEEF